MIHISTLVFCGFEDIFFFLKKCSGLFGEIHGFTQKPHIILSVSTCILSTVSPVG